MEKRTIIFLLLFVLLVRTVSMFMLASDSVTLAQTRQYHLNQEWIKMWIDDQGSIDLLYRINITLDSGSDINYILVGQPKGDFTIGSAIDEIGNNLTTSDASSGVDYKVRVDLHSSLVAGQTVTFTLLTNVAYMIYQVNQTTVAMDFVPTWWSDAQVEDLIVDIVVPRDVNASQIGANVEWDGLVAEPDGRLAIWWERQNLAPNQKYSFTVSFPIGTVEIYDALITIKPDGSIEPATSQIQREGDLYSLTDDLNSTEISIEKNNVTLDGVGHRLSGSGRSNTFGVRISGNGLTLTNVTIKNLQITAFDNGLLLMNASDCHLIDNNVHAGIGLVFCSDCEISSNTISGDNVELNGAGVVLYASFNNRIVSNTIGNSPSGSILLISSQNNKITRNQCQNGMDVDLDSGENVVLENTVNNKPLVYLEGVANYTISDAGQVILVNCTNVLVQNLTLQGMPVGIELLRTTGSTITNNTLTNLNYSRYYWTTLAGISLQASSNNHITLNNLTGIGGVGIVLTGSSDKNVLSRNIITTGSTGFSGNSRGIIMNASSYNDISLNNISNNNDAIQMSNCSYTSVSENEIAGNAYVGIVLEFSDNNDISQNKVGPSNRDGIWILPQSSDNNLNGNEISSNQRGLSIRGSSTGNNIESNNISLNTQYGISLVSATGNYFYHNNIFNNTLQISSVRAQPSEPESTNTWDNGYPSGGNYWGDYNGTDVNLDGIGDTPYVIDANNTDRYPLMAPYGISNFVVNLAGSTGPIDVGVMSNSTVSNVNVDEVARTLSLDVSGATGTSGICRITLPNVIVESLWNGNYTVLLNGEPWPFTNSSDNENTYIFIKYTHSEHHVTVIPEFSSPPAIPVLMMATLLAVTVYKKKRKNTERRADR